jgi:glycosyltransferase involved in cell wall biosynthesis
MQGAILVRYNPGGHPGGTEAFARDLVPALARHPHIESLHVAWGGNGSDPFGLDNVHAVGFPLPSAGTLGSGVYVLKLLRHSKELLRRRLDFVLALGSLPGLAYLLRGEPEPPVLLTYAFDSVAVEFRERSRVAMEEGSGNLKLGRYLPFLLAERFAVGRSDFVITSCRRTGEDLRAEYGLPAGRLRTAYLGVRDDFAEGVEEGTPEVPTFLHVATDHQRKGTYYLLKACRYLAEAGREFRVDVIGAPEAFYLRLATAWGLGDRVRFRYRLPEEELFRAYATSTALVCPSVSEGFCLPVIEAGLLGRPAVTSDAGSLPELVEDGYDGIMVPKGDAPSLAVAMARLLDEPDLAVRLGGNARRKAQTFTLGKRTPALVEILEEVTEGV